MDDTELPVDQFDPNDPAYAAGGFNQPTQTDDAAQPLPPVPEVAPTPVNAPQPQPDAQPKVDLSPVPPGGTPKQQTVDLEAKPKETPTSGASFVLANKFNFALGTPAGDAYARILAGHEDDLRQEAARQQDFTANSQRMGILQAYATARQQAGATNDLTDTEINTVMGLTQKQMADPSTILETSMMTNAVKTLYPAGGSTRQEAADQNLHVAMTIQDELEEEGALNEYGNNLLLKAQDSQSKKGFIGQATDFLGDMIPFVSQMNRHDAVPGAVNSGFWTSENQQAQFAAIRRLPTLQAKTQALQSAYDLIASHNQADAVMFLQSFLKYSTSDQYLDTVMNVGDIATALAPLGKAAFKVAAKSIASRVTTAAGERFAANAGAKVAEDTAETASRVVLSTADQAEVDAEKERIFNVSRKRFADLNEATQDVEGAANTPEYKAELDKIIAQREADLQELEASVKTQYSAGVDGGANQTFANAGKDMLRAMGESPKPDPVEIAASAGQQDMAASARVADALENASKTDPLDLGADLRKDLPTLFNPTEALGLNKAYALSRTYVNGLVDFMKASRANFEKAISLMATRTLTGEGLKAAFQAGHDAFIRSLDRVGLNDTLIGVRRVLPEETQGGVGYLVHQLGRPGGVFFSNPKEAEIWMNHYGIAGKIVPGEGPTWKVISTENLKNVAKGLAKKNGAEVVPSAAKPGKLDVVIKQQGQGFYIEVAQPVRETGIDSVYASRIETANTTPQSWFKTWLDSKGWTKFMTPSNRLSDEQRGLRATTINRMQEVQRLVSAPYKDSIGKLSSKEKSELSDFIDFMTRQENPVIQNGIKSRGIEFHSQGDFEQSFLATWKHLPSPAQSKAYWGWKATKQMEFYIRNLEQYSMRARAGSELLRLSKDSPWVEGRVIDPKDIPWGDRTANIQVIDNAGKPHTYLGEFRKDSEVQEVVKNAVENGHEVLQMADPRAAVGEGKADIHFVITKQAAHKPLTFSLVPYKEGGHTIYDYQHYVKQAMVSTGSDGIARHYGDNTVIPTTTRAEALQHVQTLEAARALYNDGDYAAFENYVRMHPPFNAENLWNKFRNGTLTKDVPFTAVRAGEGTLHTEAMQKFLNGAKVAESWNDSSLNYLKGINRQFMGQAGMGVSTISNLGTELEPLMEFDKPRLISPLPALAHGMNSAIRNKFFSQYQMRSAEHFVEEFKNVMVKGADDKELARLRENPIRALYNAKWDVSTDNKALLAAGRSYQDAALNLIGTQTDAGRWQAHVQTYLLDKVFNAAGSNAANWVYENAVQKIKNPVTFFRQMAFHTKLGLFNPVQLLLQAQTSAISAAILGKHGWKGLSGYAITRMLHVADSPENIEHAAGMASKLGWKSQDFKDAYGMMIDNGIFNSGNQLAWKFDATDAGMLKTTVGKFLDKGAWAFDEGNRINRMVAFMGTFSEWRAANPFAKIDEAAVQKIMSRYDDVSINMTHASSSALNRGFGAVAGQFLSWQERLTELLLSKRLTTGEKLRTFGVMSAMYGVPAAAGAFTLGGAEQTLFQGLGAVGVPVPKELQVGSFYQDLRAWALANGAQNNLWIESVGEGLPELLLHAATGEQYNFGARMGPGTGSVWDTLSQTTHPAELVLGASGTIAGDVWRATMPTLGDLSDVIHGNGLPPITVPDAMSALQNISTVNNAMKAYYAINLGTYMNQNAQVVDDKTTGVEGVMMGLLGLTPDRIADRSVMNQATAAAQQAQTTARQQIEKYTRMWVNETDQKLKDEYAARINQWMVMGGFTEDEKAHIASTAMTGDTTMTEQAAKKFATAEGTN